MLKGEVAKPARYTGYQECSCHSLVSKHSISLPIDDHLYILPYTGCTGGSWHYWFCHCRMAALQGSFTGEWWEEQAGKASHHIW